MHEAGPPARYAEIIVDIAAAETDRVFHYRIPPGVTLLPGHRVLVPFGARRTTGFVVGLADRTDVPPERLRDVLRVLDPWPLLPAEVMELCRWVADAYLCRLVQVLRAALPPMVRRPGPAARRDLAVEALVGPDQLERLREALTRRAPRQAQALARLADALAAGLAAPWLSELTRGTELRADVFRALERRGIVRLVERPRARDPYPAAAFEPEPLHRPTPEQAEALRLIQAALDGRRPEVVLVEGVTGSGKTEVYLHAVRAALARGRGAIVLVPEISLTPQVIDRFKRALGAPVAVLHSALGEGERHDEWQRVRSGEARVVVGARSAVFAPVQDLGLIVVDEEHAASYKQEETPRYHARTVAEARARMAGAVLVLGSATPSVESAHRARRGEVLHVRLVRRVGDRHLPRVRVVDMRLEHRRGRRGLLSPPLIEHLRATLSRGRQALLFLNRRGFATIVLCRECGAAARCPRCDVSLTYHRRGDRLRCHYCGYARGPLDRCPACGGLQVGYFGTGTQRVEQAVRELFPGVRIERMDADTVGRRGSHERVYRAFRAGRIDVLVGTQMIARGWDVPGVTLVGVIAADTSLHLPDFRSAERTFELLVQVAGRAGRGDEPGTVIVQTYNPDHYAIRAATAFEADAFYTRELAARQALGYPPYGELVRVLVSGPDGGAVAAAARELAERMRRHPGLGAGGDGQPRRAAPDAGGAELLGPVPAPIPRLRGQVRWHILLKGPDGGALRRAVREALPAAEAHAARGVRVSVDVDPQSML